MIAFQDVRSLKADLAAGRITPVELVSCFADRIKRLNALSRAFITVTAEEAMASAASLKHGDLERSAFAGIPFAS
ncbi:MAG: Asp-tRNA(Asn)/Glu-tRNA(Gln) amidotransferase GatCAB subunit A, partial [Pseudomonadota bacterium]